VAHPQSPQQVSWLSIRPIGRRAAVAALLLVALLTAPGASAQALVPPSAPQNVQATSVSGGVEVTWDAPLFDGGASAPLSYNVYRGSSLLASGLTSTSFVDSALTTAASSTYTVTAVNEAGESMHGGGPCLMSGYPFVDAFNCADLVVAVVLWAVAQIPVI